MQYVASFSGGKDSTAMILKIIELGLPLDRIEYDKGCLMVRDLDEVRYNNLILNVPICDFESINDWKVIGNIYENTELLEGEK